MGLLKPDGEKVEAMILENDGRTIRRDGQLIKKGPCLYDPMLQEVYAITGKPMLAFRKNKSIPVYLVDRDSGVTVTLEKETIEESFESLDFMIPDGTEILNPPAEGGTCPPLLSGILRPKIERQTFKDPGSIIIDGQTFSGWSVRLERSEKLIRLNTDPSLVGRAISSPLIGEAFSPPLSNREKLIMILVGLVAGLLVGLMF